MRFPNLRYWFRRFCMRALYVCPRCWCPVISTRKDTRICPECRFRSAK